MRQVFPFLQVNGIDSLVLFLSLYYVPVPVPIRLALPLIACLLVANGVQCMGYNAGYNGVQCIFHSILLSLSLMERLWEITKTMGMAMRWPQWGKVLQSPSLSFCPQHLLIEGYCLRFPVEYHEGTFVPFHFVVGSSPCNFSPSPKIILHSCRAEWWTDEEFPLDYSIVLAPYQLGTSHLLGTVCGRVIGNVG